MMQSKVDFVTTKFNRVIVGLSLIICIFGIVFAFKLPNALLPPIDRPEIVLYTGWPGKSSIEIEQSLITPLEQSLDKLNNLTEQQSRINGDRANIRLKFKANTDMQQSYIDVLAAVNQVANWPSEVPRPTIDNRSSGANATLATAMLYSRNPEDVTNIINAFNNIIKPELVNVDGVATVVPFGNSPEQRIDIEFDSKKLAMFSLPLSQVIRRLSNLSDDSGDKLIIGEREFGLSFKGLLNEDELATFPIHKVGDRIIRLQDIAKMHKRLAVPWNYAAINGNRAFYFRMKPTKGVNALRAVDEIKRVFQLLNNESLKPLGLTLVLSRDDSKDIKNAISQVYSALLLGVLMAGGVLFIFMRQVKTVVLVFISIPICLSVVIIAMTVSNFSLNVISLAGLALSVGLLLDAAIVVVDSILVLRQQGLSLPKAIEQGSKDVSSAIFSSTLSSIIIFVPILMLNSAESQLFQDLAFTMSTALLASLAVALIVLPAFARFLIADKSVYPTLNQKVGKVNHYVSLPARSKKWAAFTLIAGLPLTLIGIVLLKPDLDVLPDPKQRSMISIISFDQPITIDAVERKIAKPILQRIEEQKSLEESPKFDVSGITCATSSCFLYFNPLKGWDYEEFKLWVETKVTQELPETRVFSRQGSLLGFVLPNSRLSQLEIQGADLPLLQSAAKEVLEHLRNKFPNATIRQITPVEDQSASIVFTPKYEQLAYLDLTVQELNQQLVGLTQGIYLGRTLHQGTSYPMFLKGENDSDLSQLLSKDIYLNNIGVIKLSELTDAKLKLSPASLLRINKKATVALSILPPADEPISSFIEAVNFEMDTLLQQTQYQDLHSNISGSADRLASFINSFSQMLIFAVLLLVFLLWFSLQSWALTIAVISSMPLAAVGGIMSLQVINLFQYQSLDMVTLIGFIILLGLVINNAILLANKYQHGIQQQLTQYQAIDLAINSRKRPIYMSAATSILGMLPLILLPGEGAEMYRGLAAVIVGGMIFSATLGPSFMAAVLALPIFSPKSSLSQGKANCPESAV